MTTQIKTAFAYSIFLTKKDACGIERDGLGGDATQAEVDRVALDGPFQGAMDLADGVEFARGVDENGARVIVYRATT